MITAGGGLPMRFRKIRSNKRRLCLRKTTLLMVITILGVPASELPALAHHSFAAVFDMQGAPVKLTGTVTRFDFVNPHGFVYLDVKDDTGNVTKWKFEVTNPNALLRLGWTKETLKAGGVVTVEGPRRGRHRPRSEEHTSELPSRPQLLLRPLL